MLYDLTVQYFWHRVPYGTLYSHNTGGAFLFAFHFKTARKDVETTVETDSDLSPGRQCSHK